MSDNTSHDTHCKATQVASPATDLCNTCRNFDASHTLVYIRQHPGVDVNQPCLEIRADYALFVAVTRNCFNSVRLLVERGADVNQKREDRTLFMFAVWHHHYIIAKYLIDNGASVDEIHAGRPFIIDIITFSSIHPSSFVHYVLKHSKDINGRDKDGATPLMWALKRHIHAASCKSFVLALLELGADANLVSKDGTTALYFALFRFDYDTTYISKTPYSTRVDIFGHDDVMDLLLPHITQVDGVISHMGHTALTAAVDHNCSTHTMDALIQRNVDVNYNEADHGGSALFYAVVKDRVMHAEKLIEHGASLDCYYNETNLMSQCAISAESVYMPLLLLRHSVSTKVVCPDAVVGDTLVDVARRNNNEMFAQFYQEYMDAVQSGRWLSEPDAMEALPIVFCERVVMLACLWSIATCEGGNGLMMMPLELLHAVLQQLALEFVCA